MDNLQRPHCRQAAARSADAGWPGRSRPGAPTLIYGQRRWRVSGAVLAAFSANHSGRNLHGNLLMQGASALLDLLMIPETPMCAPAAVTEPICVRCELTHAFGSRFAFDAHSLMLFCF